MKQSSIFSIFAVALFVLGCGGVKTKPALLPGSDRDAHGCIGSAGYVWSAVQAQCLRLWEEGIKLQSAQQPESALSGYLLLSADGTKAELFLPESPAGVVLFRSFTPEGPRWTNPDGGLLLERLPLGWSLFKKGNLIYQAENPIDASK